jgi:formate dehydrogenase subunit gamma
MSSEALDQVSALLAPHAGRPDMLLPLLHEVQDALGHVPSEVVALLAQTLGLSRAEVHGVVSYYSHFRTLPPGRTVVQVCQAEACLACGGEALLAHAEAVLGCGPHDTSADGAYSLEPVYCLGLCASSPAMAVGERLYARMTPEQFDRVVAQPGVGQ